MSSLPVRSQPASLIEALLPARDAGPAGALWARNAAFALAGALLLTLSAKVQVPMWPVPMTMQSFVVLFLGATLGPRLGVAAVALYLAQGAMGLPVFANTPPAVASLAYFMGPTGGFLVGFLPAAWLAGRAARPGVPLWRVGAGLLGAHAVLLLAGLVWLAVFAQLASGAVGVGFERAFVSGVQPFLLGTLVKVALATALVGAGWSLARRRG